MLITFEPIRNAMNPYDEKLIRYINENGIAAEHLVFDRPCHTVAEAAEAVGCTPGDLVKNICMIDPAGALIVAIVKGEDRVSTSRVAALLSVDAVRTARTEEMLERTGYPVGGTPSFGYSARFIIDPRVIERDVVYSGGGSPNSLVKIAPGILAAANGGAIARIRK
jgi:Cys-tRNA(Pro)/Cys-tRNA(Cys) deacylase